MTWNPSVKPQFHAFVYIINVYRSPKIFVNYVMLFAYDNAVVYSKF
jgi:hypothetical protein